MHPRTGAAEALAGDYLHASRYSRNVPKTIIGESELFGT